MKTFEYHPATTVDEAVERVSADSLAYAGGTDLLPRLKLGLESTECVVDVKRSGLPSTIVDHGDHITLGALVTLADIERSPLLNERLPLLSEAAREAATPQIRNRATIAGNLLQRPRCWYYRTPEVDCWLKGGTDCPAREGCNEHHAVFHESPCVAVHPSDLAGCLLALRATVHLRSAKGQRALAMDELYAPPRDDRRVEHVVEADEVVTHIEIDTSTPVASTYRKAMDRQAWAFALVGVAVAAHIDSPDRTASDGSAVGAVRSVRIVLSGVANRPWRATESEAMLLRDGLNPHTMERAAASAAAGSTPLANNAYKQQLIVAMTRDALKEIAAR